MVRRAHRLRPTRRSLASPGGSACRWTTSLGYPSLRDTYKFFGRYYSVEQVYEDWRSDVQPALAKDLEAAGESTTYDKFTPEGRKLDQMSVAEWIDSRVAGGRKSSIGALLDVAYAIEYGADTTDQSALNVVYLLGGNEQTDAGDGFEVFGLSDERYHIRGGNQQLPARIARHLRNPVQLGMRLTSIARKSDGTHASPSRARRRSPPISWSSPSFRRAAHVDNSDAGFDARKNTAIQELGRGQNGKLQLQFSSRYWREPGPWPGRGNGLPIPTRDTRTRGRSAGGNPAQAGFSTTIPAARRPAPRRQRRRSRPPPTPSCRKTRRPSCAFSRRCFPAGRPNGTAGRRVRSLRSIQIWARPIPTGEWGNTPPSPATRRCGRATSSSPASTARSTTRATWRAARPKACARPQEILAQLAGKTDQAP